MSSELEAENRALRARIAELEKNAHGVDALTRALVEHVPEFLNIVNPEGRFLATGRESRGFGSVVGRSIFEFSEPASHPEISAALARACETGEPVTYEVTGFGEDRTPGHVYRVRAVPLGEPGSVTALVLVPTDITDRVKLERALVESQQALRLAVDATGMGLWRWDIAEDEVVWDARLLEIWGLDETPRNYESYRGHLHPDDRAQMEAAIRQALETGHYPTLEHRIRLANAPHEERHVLVVGTVVHDALGKPTRLMGGVLDISDQKRLERELERATRVQAIGELSAGIAHNFNNLLTVIIPNIEMALRGGASGGEREQLSSALDAALQARGVVKSLLDLARQPRKDETAVSCPTEIVVRAMAICRATFPRDIELTSSIDEGANAVPMGASELEQVLLNLLFNARDALEGAEGQPRNVRVSVDRIVRGGAASVRISVSDNGAGMPPDVKARLFEPFFTTKSPHRGSGLGLAHALLRVRQAGGTLECTSSPGEGSTFDIVLPEVVASSHDLATPSEPRATRGESILLVDDEQMVRKAVKRILELGGYEVFESASAEEARAILRGERGPRVSLVILDQSMPGESGTAALPSFRALSNAPIILFSGMVNEAPPGVAAVFEKPARAEELWRLVREVLDAQ